MIFRGHFLPKSNPKRPNKQRGGDQVCHELNDSLFLFCTHNSYLCDHKHFVFSQPYLFLQNTPKEMNFKNLFLVALIATLVWSCNSKPANTETEGTEDTVATETATETAAPALTDGEYQLAEGSLLNWEGGKEIGEDKHTGTIAISNGTFTVSGGNLTAGNFTIDMNSIVCTDLTDAEKNAKLVGHLKADDFFGVEQYPTATFAITNVAPATAEGATHTITGDLTIREKVSTVTFDANVTPNGEGLSIKAADFTFDRSKHDVKFHSKNFFEDLAGDKVIKDEIKINFDVTANPAAADAATEEAPAEEAAEAVN